MKVLIIGPLGAGKSSLAYTINKKFGLPRLNLDEVCRSPADGSYYPQDMQFAKLADFAAANADWVAEGCQKYLYEKLSPDLIIDMRISRLTAIWRFTRRFIKAKKLIGRQIDADLPVQAYHYRKITLSKIRSYDAINQEINAEITDFLTHAPVPVLTCKRFKDYSKIFEYVAQSVS